MTYQDQRNEDHPEAVRSDPVPVQRSAPDDEFDRDTDRDGVDDTAEADRGLYDPDKSESGAVEGDEGYHDSVRDQGFHDSATADEGHHENVTAEAETNTDADRDGVDDRVEDAEVRDETDVYQQAEDNRTRTSGDERTEDERTEDDRTEDERAEVERAGDERAEDERTGYDEPVIASPVDTDVERTRVDGAEARPGPCRGRPRLRQPDVPGERTRTGRVRCGDCGWRGGRGGDGRQPHRHPHRRRGGRRACRRWGLPHRGRPHPGRGGGGRGPR